MRFSFPWLRTAALLCCTAVSLGLAGSSRAPADNSTNYILTQDALNKMLGALGDFRANNLPIKIGGGSLDTEIANLEKQPKAASLIKKRGLSLREFVLTYKAAAQIREAEKARDHWGKILADPNATPQAKLDATQKLGDSLKNNLFTPEQIELIRHKMPDLENLLPAPK